MVDIVVGKHHKDWLTLQSLYKGQFYDNCFRRLFLKQQCFCPMLEKAVFLTNNTILFVEFLFQNHSIGPR
jgi:hypothetical protein